MRFLLLLIVALALMGGGYYVMTSQSSGMQAESRDAANDAKANADAYKKNQEDMMKQLQQ